MRINGKQARKVILEKKTVTYNNLNEEVTEWNPDLRFPQGKIWAEMWDQGGKETTSSGQTVAYSDVRFKCRYIEGLNESDYRIRELNAVYDIENIKEIGRREGQIMMCQRQDNA